MDVVSTIFDEAGLRKAAVLVASLDPRSADMLLGQLTAEQAELVRDAVLTLEEVDTNERQRVLDEFRRVRPMVAVADQGGIELDRLPARPANQPHGRALDRALDQADAKPTQAPIEEAGSEVPFEFLQDAEDERLADLLCGERPSTVALVLSHLPPHRAGEVLTCLPAGVQVEVVRRLVDIENTDAATVREVERALQTRWSRQYAAERAPAAGPDVAAKILASCDGQIRGQILDNLAVHDQPLAARYGGRAIEFEELAGFDAALLASVLRSADPEVVQAALLGVPPLLLEHFLSCMPPAKAKRLRAKLDRPGPIRLSDVEEARRRLAALAQRLAANGSDKSSFAA